MSELPSGLRYAEQCRLESDIRERHRMSRDMQIILAILDAERLLIFQLRSELKDLLETRGDLERQLIDLSKP